MITTDPIVAEAGDGELLLGTINPNNPHEVQINPDILRARQKFLISFAQGLLWNPTDNRRKKDVFAVGMECGQYGLVLGQVLEFGHSIGCQVIQPSANHVDLAKAATDSAYRLKIWNTFQMAEMPLTSVSIHCDAYAALAILDNPRAGMFTPTEIKEWRSDLRGAGLAYANSQAHLNKLALMIIGAAQLGIPALHLFWGMPEDLKPYGWPPQKPTDVLAMRSKFVNLVSPLVKLAERLGVSLCHEIHFGTIAMTADDLIEIWDMLEEPDNFAVGFDPSHFWHGETWLQAMDKLRRASMKVVLAHAKNTVVRPGRPMLSLEMDDRLRGMAFTSLDDTAGIVSMWEYLGALTISGIVEFWLSRGLPVPVHVEAENPFFRINEVTTKGVAYLRNITNNLQLPQGHFTDAMRRQETPIAPVIEGKMFVVDGIVATTAIAIEPPAATAPIPPSEPLPLPLPTPALASDGSHKILPKKETIRLPKAKPPATAVEAPATEAAAPPAKDDLAAAWRANPMVII